MWVRRPVTNRRAISLSLLLIAGLAIGGVSYAQKSKTVGDILKNIEKKSDSLKVKKKKSALPSFKKSRAAKVNLRKVKPPEQFLRGLVRKCQY